MAAAQLRTSATACLLGLVAGCSGGTSQAEPARAHPVHRTHARGRARRGPAAGQDAAAAEVRITATRCKAHALTKSKRSFTFPLFVAVGDGDAVPVQVTADAAGEAALQALLDATCDLSSPAADGALHHRRTDPVAGLCAWTP